MLYFCLFVVKEKQEIQKGNMAKMFADRYRNKLATISKSVSSVSSVCVKSHFSQQQQQINELQSAHE